jgi:hypothetical protein
MAEFDPIQHLLDEYEAGGIDPSGDWRGSEAIDAAKEIAKLRAIVKSLKETYLKSNIYWADCPELCETFNGLIEADEAAKSKEVA